MSEKMTDLPWEPSMNLVEARRTLAERLEGIAVGDRVVMLQRWTFGEKSLQGTRGTVTSVDVDDAGRTFEVKNVDEFNDKDAPIWLHRVAKVVDAPVAKPVWEWNAAAGSPSRETTLSTQAERTAGLAVGDTVRVLQNWGSEYEDVQSAVGTLASIDIGDSRMTFRVTGLEGAPGGDLWVHRVEKVVDEVPTDEETPEQKEIADLKQQVANERRRANDANTRLVAFQKQVREKAIEVAEAESWCDEGLNEALEELGLERKENPEYEIEVTVKFKFRARRTNSSEKPGDDFIRDSLSGIENVCLDNDWDQSQSDYDVEYVSSTEA